MKRKSLKIEDFIQIQELQEKYDIPFASAISTVIVELINRFAHQGYDQVYIELNEQMVPPTFRINSCLWAKQLKHKIVLPCVQSYKRAGVVIVEARQEEFSGNWLKTLKLNLESRSIIIYPLMTVPNSYQHNPYLIVNKLRKVNIEVKVALSSTQLTIWKRHSNSKHKTVKSSN